MDKPEVKGSPYDNIPAELKALQQWVCYQLVDNGKPRLDKIPKNPKTGGNAQPNNPKTWGTFNQALAVVERFDGLGFVWMAEDPYTAIDLDDCVNGGEIEPWAADIVNRLDSYSEYSPSRTGVHCVVAATKTHKACKKNKLEVFGQTKFYTMTGNRIPGTPATIEHRQSELDAVLLERWGPVETKPKAAVKSKAAAISGHSDIEILSKATAAKNGPKFMQLWNGDTSGHGNDDSVADAALCEMLAFWTGPDPGAIDRLFRQSKLYRSDKWERQDYRDRTIDFAISKCTEFYDWNRQRANPQTTPRGDDGSESNAQICAVSDGPQDFPLTDLGNAERLIAAHGANLRYDVNRGAWLVWNSVRWEYDADYGINRLAANVVRGMYDLLKDADENKRKAIFAHISKSESAPRLAAMVNLAAQREGVPVLAQSLDHDPWLLNCLNGTVDLRTGELRPHTREDLITKLAPVEYDPAATCPRWMQFLDEVFQKDKDIVGFVKRMAGYTLTSDTREESVFILTGKGQNGKTKMVETLRAVLGDYAGDTPVSTFTDNRESNTADLAALMGKRLVTAAEGEAPHGDRYGRGQSFNESLLKTLSGGDPVTCRHLYQPYFTYTPTFKVLFSTNEIPRLQSQNFAMKRRIKLLPFRQRFYDPEDEKTPVKDSQLLPKLLAEKNGVLAWMVQGCLEWQKDGLQTPAVIREEVNRLFESQDPLAEFLDDRCDLYPGASVEVSLLWQEYNLHCDETKRKPAFKASNSFSRSLTQRDGIDSGKGTGGTRLLRGITLKSGGSGDILDFSEKSPMKKEYEHFSESGVYLPPSATNPVKDGSLSEAIYGKEEDGEGL